MSCNRRPRRTAWCCLPATKHSVGCGHPNARACGAPCGAAKQLRSMLRGVASVIRFRVTVSGPAGKGSACAKRVQAGETKDGRKHSNCRRMTCIGDGQQAHVGRSAAWAPDNLPVAAWYGCARLILPVLLPPTSSDAAEWCPARDDVEGAWSWWARPYHCSWRC